MSFLKYLLTWFYDNNIIYYLIFGWIIFSTYYIVKLAVKKNLDEYNPYLYNSIPSVFTTLGVLGTFIGILIGLQNFNVDTLNESIPSLLEGMKTAFITSVIGIILSIIFKTLGQYILRMVELEMPPKQDNELTALSEILNVLKESKDLTNENFKELNLSLSGDADNSVSTQLIKLRNQVSDNHRNQEKQNELLDKIQLSLIGNDETSLLTQLEKMRVQLLDSHKEQKSQNLQLEKVGGLITTLDENLRNQITNIHKENTKGRDLLLNKFDEFGEILKKNNTEALVEVMKQVTETFNAQMNELIVRLVKENFEELNNSVQNLNTWQKENKEMIDSLTNQFVKVSNEFEITAKSIQDITQNTEKLTNDNSHLSNLIQELQKVMIEDTKYQQIVDKLTNTIETLKQNTETFDETTNKLNNWIIKEHNFKQSVDILISRLEEIERIKDINGEFWNQTRIQLNEGVSVISNATRELRGNLDTISEEFTEQLNQTLTSLDELIQRLANQYVLN
jgi:biopolymer transport protein ExbB/TolQ